MTPLQALPERLLPRDAARYLADLGFLSSADLPDRPGPAYLLVALRPRPTLRHYDPERLGYWVNTGGRGSPRVLDRDTRLPLDVATSWGVLRTVDRLEVSNEFLSVGGRLLADLVDEATVAVVSSPAPILRRGGHSQGWDHGAEAVGAFFGRLLVAVDYRPGFEAQLASATPVARYSAFAGDLVARYRHRPTLRSLHPELWTLMNAEAERLARDAPAEWDAGEQLRIAMDSAT
jgi:hypothetical protein